MAPARRKLFARLFLGEIVARYPASANMTPQVRRTRRACNSDFFLPAKRLRTFRITAKPRLDSFRYISRTQTASSIAVVHLTLL